MSGSDKLKTCLYVRKPSFFLQLGCRRFFVFVCTQRTFNNTIITIKHRYIRMFGYIFQNCKLPLFRVNKYFPIYAELSPIPMNKYKLTYMYYFLFKDQNCARIKIQICNLTWWLITGPFCSFCCNFWSLAVFSGDQRLN